MNPKDLLYAPTHEWVHVGDDSIATIGISEFALAQLTDLVYMELPSVGESVSAGEPFGEVESVKAVSPMYSPVNGEVTEANTQVADNVGSGELADDPYDKGWIIKVKLSDASELDQLLDHAAYQKQCSEEG